MSLQRSITQIQVNLNLTMKSTSNRSQQPTPSFKIWLSEDSTTLLEPPETQTVRTILIMNTKRRRKKHTLTILAPVVSVIEVKVSKLLTIGNVPRKMTIITTSSTKTQDKSGIRTQVTIGEGISTRLAHHRPSRRAERLTKMSMERVHLAPLLKRNSMCTSDLGIYSLGFF